MNVAGGQRNMNRASGYNLVERHHTQSCGDPLFLLPAHRQRETIEEQEELHWYPMRVTYHRELMIKQHLDALKIENFVPMRHELVETREGKRRMLLPAISNLIFVRSTQEQLTYLKMTRQELEPLRYIMKPKGEANGWEIMQVPDRQMEYFIRVASAAEESVQFLDYDDYLRKVGKKVRIVDGDFAGVEGVIKRIKKNKYVVVQIEGVAAVAITYVPAHYLTEIQFHNS